MWLHPSERCTWAPQLQHACVWCFIHALVSVSASFLSSSSRCRQLFTCTHARQVSATAWTGTDLRVSALPTRQLADAWRCSQALDGLAAAWQGSAGDSDHCVTAAGRIGVRARRDSLLECGIIQPLERQLCVVAAGRSGITATSAAEHGACFQNSSSSSINRGVALHWHCTATWQICAWTLAGTSGCMEAHLGAESRLVALFEAVPAEGVATGAVDGEGGAVHSRGVELQRSQLVREHDGAPTPGAGAPLDARVAVDVGLQHVALQPVVPARRDAL